MYLEIAKYCKTIKGIPILDNITCGFERGRIYGLQGQNGSGKTMLLRGISGLIFPSSGSITIENKRLGKDISFPKSLGLLIEHPSFIGNKRPYRKYSLGMKQRLGIACAIMETPDIILLDEPTNALDPTGIELAETILIEAKRNGALIIIACHDRNELQRFSDEIITLAEGRIMGRELVEHETA